MPTWSAQGPQLARGFGTWTPTVNVALPGQQGVNFTGRVQFAAPPIPDLGALRKCHADSSDQDEFIECMVEKAMPGPYRLTQACLEEYDDPVEAVMCSSGDEAARQKYERIRDVQECAERASDDSELAMCLGEQVLGVQERRYANCLIRNANSMAAAAICAFGGDLTPEQQIALNCAVTSGGEPMTFAACTGGQLVEREINKCWEHGIATPEGCFGPNNEIRRFWNGVDGTLRQALGSNNDLYRAFNLYKDNVLMPGPNHEMVRAANTVLGDLRNGPGPNNDLVRAGQTVSQGLQSIGNAVSNATGIRF